MANKIHPGNSAFDIGARPNLSRGRSLLCKMAGICISEETDLSGRTRETRKLALSERF